MNKPFISYYKPWLLITSVSLVTYAIGFYIWPALTHRYYLLFVAMIAFGIEQLLYKKIPFSVHPLLILGLIVFGTIADVLGDRANLIWFGDGLKIIGWLFLGASASYFQQDDLPQRK